MSEGAEVIRVVLVGVEGEVNLGFVVRLCKNFGVDELALVAPKVDPFSEDVKRFAAKGVDYLLSSRVRIYNTLAEALGDVGLSACTSSLVSPDGKDVVRRAIELEEFTELAARYSSVAIVFGRESVGLTRDEIKQCHLLVHIAANPEYPVLNLSHAVAIALYVLYKRLNRPSLLDKLEEADETALAILGRYIDALAKLVASDELQAQSFSLVVKRVLRRAPMTKAEVGLLTTFVRRLISRLKVEQA